MTEYHVSNFIVRCRRKHLDSIVESISRIPGVKVKESDPSGNMIVTAEGESHRFISDITEQIRDMTYVVDIAAVYHEYASGIDIQRQTK